MAPTFVDARRTVEARLRGDHSRPSPEYDVPGLLDYRYWGWTREAPPLDWYAAALHVVLGSGPADQDRPVVFELSLARAALYFGDRNVALEALARAQPHASGSEALESLLLTARAQKDRGRFEDSLGSIRRAIAHSQAKGAWQAYLLFRYAKLSHDYQQKQAWYLALHRVAKSRFDGLSDTSAPEPGSRLALWRHMTRDSYAKAIYQSQADEAEALFAELIDARDVQEDTRLRTEAHLHLCRLARSRAADTSNTDLVAYDRSLMSLAELAIRARHEGNERAATARSIQVSEHRAVRAELGFRQAGEPLDQAAVEYEIHQLEQLSAVARRYGDQKSEARALMAKGRHARLVADFASGPQKAKERLTYAAREMRAAANVLEQDREPVSWLFLDALEGAGDLFVEAGDWRRAEKVFARALEYLEGCHRRVEDGEAELVKATGEDRIESPPEIAVLSAAERRQVLEGFRVDYRMLLRRTGRVGFTLGRVSAERNALLEREKLLSGWQVRTHGIMQHLRVLRQARQQQGDREAMDTIDQIEEAMGDLMDPIPMEGLPLLDSVRQELKLGMVWQQLSKLAVINFEESPQPIQVKSARAVLRAICETALSNAVEAAVRAGFDSVTVTIRARETEEAGWLGFSDNVGAERDLRNAVAAVNQGLRPSSSRGASGGSGLLALRTMLVNHLDLSHPWEIESCSSSSKTLWIPAGLASTRSHSQLAPR